MAPFPRLKNISAQLLAVLLMAIVLPQPVKAGALTDLLVSKILWSTFDWAHATQSRIWQDPNFRAYESPTRSPTDDQFEKNQKVLIDSKTYNASLVRIPLQLDLSDYLVLATDLESSTCEQLVSNWNKRFGRHQVSMDNSYKVLDGYSLGELLHIWKLNNTTVIAKCTTTGPTLPGYFSIRFQPSSFSLPEPPIYLNCTRTFIPSGSNSTPRVSSTMAITIIPARGVVTDAGGLLMISKVKTNYSTIEWTITTDILVQQIRIDRSNGALTGSATMKRDDQPVGIYEGVCERRSPTERLF